MIEGAIFDLDGTILDSMPMWKNFGANYLASLGIKAEPRLNRILFPKTSIQSAHYLIERYQVEKTTEEILSDMAEFLETYYSDEVELKDGIIEFLEEINAKGIPLAVATVTNQTCTRAALKRHDILDMFSTIVTTDDVGIGKESPKVFLEAANHINCQPEKSYVFEDALHAVRTAKSAGFRTVGIYEVTNQHFQEKLKKECDYYLLDYSIPKGIFNFLMNI